MAATRDAIFSERDTTAGGHEFVWTGHNVASGGRMCVAIFVADGPAARIISTLTSPNLTWTRMTSAIDSGNFRVVDIWKAWSSGALTSEVLTQADSGGASFNRRSFVFLTVQGTDATGAGATGASAAGATGGDPTVSITPQAADSYLVAGVSYREGGAGDQAPTGGATSEYATTPAGFAFMERVISKASSSTSAHTLALTGDDVTSEWQMAAVEIKATAGADLNALIGEPISGSSVIN